MDILSLFVTVPVLTILALVFTKGLKQARIVSMVGSLIQLGMAINLVKLKIYWALLTLGLVNILILFSPLICRGLKAKL